MIGWPVSTGRSYVPMPYVHPGRTRALQGHRAPATAGEDGVVSALSLPPVPYHATAVRPHWAQLPAELRAAVTERLGAPITEATRAGGGFTQGFAGVLGTATGDRVFVKTASLTDPGGLADTYAWEAAVTAALPTGIRVARPRWTLAVAGHFVLCLDAVDGAMPTLPWSPGALAATLDAYAAAAKALRDPPPALVALRPPTLSDLARNHLTGWQELAATESAAPEPAPPRAQSVAPRPGGDPHAGDDGRGDGSGHTATTDPTRAAPVRADSPDDGRRSDDRGGSDLLELARARLAELAALEALLPAYARQPGMIHGDLRLDNVLIDARGAAWFCDWTWVCFGPAWFDLASLLVTAYASGLAADAMFAAHPAARDAPADALDVSLAALSGYWLTAATADSGTASPHIRAHQRWSGTMALAWLARRRGWR